MLLKISQILQENTSAGVFFNKVAGPGLQKLKTDSNTGVFLWNLRTF